MLRFVKIEKDSNCSANIPETTNIVEEQSQVQQIMLRDNEQQASSSKNMKEASSSKYMKVDLSSLPVDPGERPLLEFYHVSQRDEIRRTYLQKGPYQPRNHSFKPRQIGRRLRKFNPAWFDDYKYWLEYSIEKEAAFCLCCYLFKSEIKNQGGAISFVKGGFKAWNKRERLDLHSAGNPHNQAVQKCQDLLNRSQSISTFIDKQTDLLKHEDQILLNACIDCVRFLLQQRLPFNCHDENEDSVPGGNFLELLQFYANRNEMLGHVMLKNAPNNLQMECNNIQKDIVHVIAKETIEVIMQELGDDFFGITVEESRDVSSKEHLALVLRYVNSGGIVVERFVGMKHVSDASALSLKATIYSMLSDCGLSPSRIRGQSYNGASDMRDSFNDLKTLIMEETQSAYYIHCFAHELQSSLVFVAKNHFSINDFFEVISRLLSLIRLIYKRPHQLREKQITKVVETLVEVDLQASRDLNPETSINRPGYAHLGSHFGLLLYVKIIYSSIREVLEDIMDDGICQDQRAEARRLLTLLVTFDFVFCLHLMVEILGITNELNTTIKKEEQNNVNIIHLLRACKQRLHETRNEGWRPLLDSVNSFCNEHDVEILNMEQLYAHRRSGCSGSQVSNLHYYQVNLFYSVIDMQLQELNSRFDELNETLLVCMASFCPSKYFQEFNEDHLLKMAELYPCEFSKVELEALREQLQNYIVDIRGDARFNHLDGMGDVARKMVETNKHTIYPLVYLLLKLALILPVATSNVERTFSAMKLIKSELRKKIGDQFMNDCLVSYIEKDVLDGISNDMLLKYFIK